MCKNLYSDRELRSSISGLSSCPIIELRYEAVDEQIAKGDRLLAAEKSQEAVVAYQKAFEAARDLKQVKSLAEKLGELEVEVDVTRHLGFVQRWKVIGPFDNTGETGFDASYQPESVADFGATSQGKQGPVQWIEHKTKDEYGRVDLNELLGKKKAVCAYAVTEFFCAGERRVQLRMGSYNAVKLWVNGSLLFDATRQSTPDRA